VGSTGDGISGMGCGVDCNEAVRQLYDYLDGELTDDRRHEIAEHLDYCSPCSGAAEFEAELRHVIADRCRDRVPDSLLQRVADCIEAERNGGASEVRRGVGAPPS
jgi:mycothiol system anti-sigma-R factor